MSYLEPDGGTHPEGELPHDLEIPDDLSSLEEEVTRALVLTQVASAQALAAAGALNGLAIDAVDSPVGAIAICRDPAGTGPASVASVLSAAVKGVPVILLTRRGGQVAAQRWLDGQAGDDLPAGLVLSDAPAVLEDLVLGTTDAADVEGVVTSVGMSRWKAMRTLAAQARSARRAAE
ncbi:hypothetical protein [Cellulomonas sp. P24]|uniref:hypothetical protein n=1 Tax=Cellulomonas sp. P24 TaxID=2885206 RepID=UPI00216B53C3|nr:hypothetical protein [Cellulomonas sp. P24]MCR6491248.1 hypothetical protein [Cellulomonas sp. P24]